MAFNLMRNPDTKDEESYFALLANAIVFALKTKLVDE